MYLVATTSLQPPGSPLHGRTDAPSPPSSTPPPRLLLHLPHGGPIPPLPPTLREDSSTYTYLLADLNHHERPAVLIDPVDKTVDRDLSLANDLGLSLVYAANTHVHADHVTATGLIKAKLPGVKSVISRASKARADVLVDGGDRLRVGNLVLEVRPTPGHTLGCVTYVTGDGPGQVQPRMAFTGDALLIRGCGRTDFQGGSSETLYKSVNSQIFSLPEETLVFPAHDYRGFSVSTVGEEMVHKPRLTKGLEAFKEIMGSLNLAYPKMIDVAVPANVMCGLQGLDGTVDAVPVAS